MGLLWRTVDLFMLGDQHAERSFAELAGCGQTDGNAAVGFVVSAMRVMLSIRSGRLAEGERFAADYAEQGRVTGDADSLGWYAAQLGDADTAARAYTLLLPYAGLPMVASLGVVCFGSAHHALGVASLMTGESSRAVEHFRMAIEQNTALGHWPAVALSRHRLGQALAWRGERGDVRSAEAELAAAAQEAAPLDMMLQLVSEPLA